MIILFFVLVSEKNRFNANCGLMEFDNILIKKILYIYAMILLFHAIVVKILFLTNLKNSLIISILIQKSNSSILLFPKNIPTSYKNNEINKIEIKYTYKTKFWSSFVNIIAYLFHNSKNIYIYNDVYFNTISFKGRTLSGKFLNFSQNYYMF